jgi:hypothetical protein
MRVVNRVAALLLLPTFLLSTPALAQQQSSVVDRETLSRAVGDKVERERDDRETIRQVLQRDEARQLAERMGLSLERADSAIATLDGEDLRQLAQHADAADAALAGGANYVVISVTTLLLLLILIVLIAR